MTTTLKTHAIRASPSNWSTVSNAWDRFKISCLKFFVCCDSTLIEELEYESRIRDDIREEMVVHQLGDHRNFVDEAASAVLKKSGYDLSTTEAYINTLSNQRLTFEQWEQEFSNQGVDPVVGITRGGNVRVVPKFAAAMVLGLRAKFGCLPPSEANRLLIEREYLRLAREGHVRNVDIVAHSQYVLNAFFYEDVLDRNATIRLRVPAWLRRAFGINNSVVRGVVC